VVGGSVVTTAVGPIAGILDTLLATVNPLIGSPIADPLSGGQVTVSLDDLLSVAGVANVNDLAPGTDLLSFLPDALVAKITSLTNTVLSEVTAAAGGLGIIDAAIASTALTTATSALALLPAVTGGPFATAVAAAAQLIVDTQSVSDGAFTETALTVGIGASGSIASVALANATVGPNTPTDPDPPTPRGPPAPAAPPDPPVGGITTTALAATGVDMSGPVAVVAALSAAGIVGLVLGHGRRRARHSE